MPAGDAAVVNAESKLTPRRADQCCYIIGDVRGEWDYCTGTRHTKRNGKRVSYCQQHFELMFTAPKPVAIKFTAKLDEAA